MTASAYEEITYPDGRHALAHPEAVADRPLYNEDLAPVPVDPMDPAVPGIVSPAPSRAAPPDLPDLRPFDP